MLSEDIYDLDCFNGRNSDALPSGRYPSLDDMDHTGEDASDPDREDAVMDTRDTLRVPRPRLKSRPPIDFYGQNYAPSFMSGSTLRTNTSAFPPKIIDTPQRPSPSVIATLTIAELYFNPHFRELRERYDYVTGVLASYMDRGKPTKGNVSVPDLRQCACFLFLLSRHALNKILQLAPALHTDFHRPHTSAVGSYDVDSHSSLEFNVDSHLSLEFNNIDSHEMSSLGPSNSRTSSSLGPSDSASQSARSTSDRASEVKYLLGLVEAPSVRPACVNPSVLWHYEDCFTDKTLGDIVTEANKHRPKMHLALRREDGSALSSIEVNNVQLSADLLATRLIELATNNPQLHRHGSKLPTKSNIKKWFKAEYSQGILELEAEQPYLRLCSAHWKADNMIGQAFLRQSDAERRRRTREASSIPDQPDPQKHGDSAPAPIPISSVVNVAKRAFELSPGPKSPSASHTQKRSKDRANNSGQKNKDPSVVPSNRKYSLH